MEKDVWQKAGIRVCFQQFIEPVRPQLHNDFIPKLSIADLYMNVGEETIGLLREWRKPCELWFNVDR